MIIEGILPLNASEEFLKTFSKELFFFFIIIVVVLILKPFVSFFFCAKVNGKGGPGVGKGERRGYTKGGRAFTRHCNLCTV